MPDTPNGRFCWYELMTTDPEAAQAFYTRVAGWTTSVWEEGEKPYTMWINDETPVGGVMKLPDHVAADGAPPCWLGYVSTPDADATVDKAVGLGGKLLNKLDIPKVGRIAVLADPTGGVLSVLQPEESTPGHDAVAEVGEFSWHELATRDRKAAWGYYSALFGWQEADQMDMGEMGIYQMFGRGAHPLGGMFNGSEEMPVGWMFYVRVQDVSAAVETVKDLGGEVLNGPMPVPGGDLVAQCMDPQGVVFAMHSTAGDDTDAGQD